MGVPLQVSVTLSGVPGHSVFQLHAGIQVLSVEKELVGVCLPWALSSARADGVLGDGKVNQRRSTLPGGRLLKKISTPVLKDRASSARAVSQEIVLEIGSGLE